jgi:hypothetical protein
VAKPEAAVIKPEQCVFESTGVGPQHRDKPCAKTHQPPFKFGDPHIRHCTKKAIFNARCNCNARKAAMPGNCDDTIDHCVLRKQAPVSKKVD